MSIYSIISQVVPAASGVAAGALVRATCVTQAILYAGVGWRAWRGCWLPPRCRSCGASPDDDIYLIARSDHFVLGWCHFCLKQEHQASAEHGKLAE